MTSRLPDNFECPERREHSSSPPKSYIGKTQPSHGNNTLVSAGINANEPASSGDAELLLTAHVNEEGVQRASTIPESEERTLRPLEPAYKNYPNLASVTEGDVSELRAAMRRRLLCRLPPIQTPLAVAHITESPERWLRSLISTSYSPSYFIELLTELHKLPKFRDFFASLLRPGRHVKIDQNGPEWTIAAVTLNNPKKHFGSLFELKPEIQLVIEKPYQFLTTDLCKVFRYTSF